ERYRMDSIQSVSNTSSTSQNSTGGVSTLGKDEFLQLLVTKLQNQDPLRPMEDEDFIAQLASFSSLEQMCNIAEAVAESNDLDFLQMQALNNAMAAGFVGKDVKASYSSIYVEEGSSPRISFTLSQHAEEVIIGIKDAQGVTVATLTGGDLGSGPHTIEWDGCDSAGNRVPDGQYTVEAEAVDVSGSAFTPELALAGTVEAVIYRDGLSYLRVGSVEIPLGDVTAIGERGAFNDD
ncbi:MAG: flagellar hook assembly protein FlgD, partial [Candidatus Zixiibacteriota bacterium]